MSSCIPRNTAQQLICGRRALRIIMPMGAECILIFRLKGRSNVEGGIYNQHNISRYQGDREEKYFLFHWDRNLFSAIFFFLREPRA
mmetsp:Transcript_7346/g.12842  ORF Transcript_7346/g.12842 Transcript_7346/m.12842 type:complete len:86 (-) Transcript_7346:105-362(-)